MSEYPNFRWWQFIKKRRFAKSMSYFSSGERVKITNGTKFTDDLTIDAWIKPKLKEDK